MCAELDQQDYLSLTNVQRKRSPGNLSKKVWSHSYLLSANCPQGALSSSQHPVTLSLQTRVHRTSLKLLWVDTEVVVICPRGLYFTIKGPHWNCWFHPTSLWPQQELCLSFSLQHTTQYLRPITSHPANNTHSSLVLTPNQECFCAQLTGACKGCGSGGSLKSQLLAWASTRNREKSHAVTAPLLGGSHNTDGTKEQSHDYELYCVPFTNRSIGPHSVGSACELTGKQGLADVVKFS